MDGDDPGAADLAQRSRGARVVGRRLIVIAVTIVMALVAGAAGLRVYDATAHLVRALPDPCALLTSVRARLSPEFLDTASGTGDAAAKRRTCGLAGGPVANLVYQRYGRDWLFTPAQVASAAFGARYAFLRGVPLPSEFSRSARLDGIGDEAFVVEIGASPNEIHTVTVGARRANAVVEFSFVDADSMPTSGRPRLR